MTDAFEDEAEPTVSIRDLLDEVEEKELEADLVLGGDEGKECTYNKGYMKRQAIFSCLTCVPDGNGGVCTACSLSCHDGHEIVELWTKRNFRCDCGNSKFGISYCKLFPSKETENSENLYNHNFKGLYCTCNRIYPDPNSDEQEEMIQCCVCEDWFHEEHLTLDSSNQIPKDEEGEPLYEDFICNNCSVSFTFLTLYPPTIFARNMDNTKGKEVIENNPSSPVVSLVGPTGEGSSINPINNCKLGVKLNDLEMSKKPMFLTRNWREIICKCEECVNYYKEKKIGFLLDKEDSIAEYEKIAKQKRKDKIEKEEDIEQTLLNQLDHVGKIEFLSGVADMKSEIHSFLENIDQSKPVTSEDIHQIFENLAKKRRRM